MDRKIEDILDDLLSEIEMDKHPNPYLYPMLMPNWSSIDIGKEYFKIFKETFNLDDDDVLYQNLGGAAYLSDPQQIADYSILLAHRNGITQGLNQVKAYFDSDKIESFQLMLLQTIRIEEDFEFCNGVKIIQPKSIPNKFIADSLKVQYDDSFTPVPRIGSALIKDFQQSKFIGKKESSHWFDNEKSTLDHNYTVLYCLSLARPTEYGIQEYASSLIVNEEMPFWRPLVRWRFLPYKKPKKYTPDITENELVIADGLLSKFIELPEKLKSKLTISMEKLNEFGSGMSLVERAINLRICLESIFLNDGNKEQLRFTLSMRAALFLGNTFDERKKISKTIKTAYDFTSTAVHSGELEEKKYETLLNAANLGKEALIRIIENGNMPDWTEVELGNR